MTTLLLFLLLVGLLFGVGAIVTTAKWLLIIALVFWIVGALHWHSSRAP